MTTNLSKRLITTCQTFQHDTETIFYNTLNKDMDKNKAKKTIESSYEKSMRVVVFDEDATVAVKIEATRNLKNSYEKSLIRIHGISMQGDGDDWYIGESNDFFRKNMHGIGRYIHRNGDTYLGEWKNGKMHGKGTLIYAGGEYEGMWENGMLRGKKQDIYCYPFPGDDSQWVTRQSL